MNCLGGRMLSCARNISEGFADLQEKQTKLLGMAACLTQSAAEFEQTGAEPSISALKTVSIRKY